MAKSSVNRKLSRYGKRFNLRFHIRQETYILSDMEGNPSLIAVFYKTDSDIAVRTWELLENLYNKNQELEKALKNEYMSLSGCLCDACKYEEEIYTNNWFIGEDYDVKCNKGHDILADDEVQECNDFELRLEDLE